ncbi:MAG: hypothetical protein FWG40_05825, partial [Peptococcaceae bacterium]|nr:hypothetical protein [Peptococcaceae bacterium]
SFAYTKHPRELLKYLEGERKFAVDDQGGGIYYIRGEVFPIQLVERNKLSKDENLFLKMLGSNLKVNDVLSILEVHKEKKILDLNNVYLDRVRQANKVIFEEALNMSTAAEYFFEVAEKKGWLEEKWKEGIEEGMEKGREEGIVEGLEKGREEGREEGTLRRLVDQINRKKLKNKTREQIIDELEMRDSDIKVLDQFENYTYLLNRK